MSGSIMAVTLRSFELVHAATVRAWAEAAAELSPWPSPPTVQDFAAALEDPEVEAFGLSEGGVLIAYGELWIEGAEVECAHHDKMLCTSDASAHEQPASRPYLRIAR